MNTLHKSQAKKTPMLCEEALLLKMLQDDPVKSDFNKLVRGRSATYEMCCRLAGYYTDRLILKDSTETLFLHSLKKGIQRWNMAQESRCDMTARMRSFVSGIIEDAPKLLDYVIYMVQKSGTRITWTAMDGPFIEWLNRYTQNPTIRYREEPYHPRPEYLKDSDVRMKVLLHIAKGNDIGIINGQLEELVRP